MNIHPALIASIACPAFVGCSVITSTEIREPSPILAPSNLSNQEIKIAIIKAIPGAPQELSANQKMGDNALRAAFGLSYRKADDRNKKGHYYVEDVKPNSVVIGQDRRTHYLRVEYIIEANKIRQVIDGSRNLNQTDTSIHKNAYDWMTEMEGYIRQSLGRESAIKASSPQANG